MCLAERRRPAERRQYAETANGLLKGGFVNIERKFIRVLGITKVTVLLAFTLVGYNLDRIRSSWRAQRQRPPP